MTRVWKNAVAEWIAEEIPLLTARRDDATNPVLKDYWRGQRDAHCFLAEVIERGDYLAQADRSPEGHDPEEGHGAKHESPVGKADAPERCSEHSIHSSSG